jgi:hypothetical protein
MHKALVGHKKLHTGKTTACLSSFLSGKESVCEKVLMNAVVPQHPVIRGIVPGEAGIVTAFEKLTGHVQGSLGIFQINAPNFRKKLWGNTLGTRGVRATCFHLLRVR